jgi:hypothetical protein
MDWSWVDTAVGAASAMVAYTLGQARGRRSRSNRMLELEPPPVCGCTHHYSLHDDDRVCHGVNRVKEQTTREGVSWISQPCGCKRYTGPETLPRYVP